MVDWYASSNLGTHASLGSKGPSPGSLAGLHEARKANLAQYFTPETVANSCLTLPHRQWTGQSGTARPR
jgi:hypothetical protein